MLKSIILLVTGAALILALSIAASGPGSQLGLWDYGTGLKIIRMAALPVMVAAGLSLISVLIAFFVARDLLWLSIVATIAAGAAAFVPIKMKQLAEANPVIHDITTDFDNPPEIVAGAKFERINPASYVGDEPAPRSTTTTADAQRAAFPEIKTFYVANSREEAAARTREILKDMKMTVLDETVGEQAHRIEATYKSAWFGFIDDFVVRLIEEDGRTRVDIRSKSRVGVSDLGANARRVKEFSTRLRASLNTA